MIRQINSNNKTSFRHNGKKQQMMQSPLSDEASVWYVPSVHPKTTEAYVKDVFENRSKIGMVDHVDIVVNELDATKCSMFVHITCWYRSRFSDQFRKNVMNRVQGYNRLRHGGNKRNWFWVCFPSTSEGKKEIDTDIDIKTETKVETKKRTMYESKEIEELTVENLQQLQELINDMDKPMQLSELQVDNPKTVALKNILGMYPSTPVDSPGRLPIVIPDAPEKNGNIVDVDDVSSDNLAPITPLPFPELQSESNPVVSVKKIKKIHDWSEAVSSDDEDEDDNVDQYNTNLSFPKNRDAMRSAFEKPKLTRQEATIWNIGGKKSIEPGEVVYC